MFNPDDDQHGDDCRCERGNAESNLSPNEDEITFTTNSLGERVRQSAERIRLAQDYARKLWAKGYRGRCLWSNVLRMFEPPSWSPEWTVWRDVRNNLP